MRGWAVTYIRGFEDMEPELTSTQAGESTAGGESHQLPSTTAMRSSASPQGPPETATGSAVGSQGSKLTLIHQDIFLSKYIYTQQCFGSSTKCCMKTNLCRIRDSPGMCIFCIMMTDFPDDYDLKDLS